MGQDFRGLNSFLGVGLEHSSEEVKCLCVYILVERGTEVEFHLLVVFVDLLALLSFEERPADEQDVEDGSQREYVTFGLDVFSLVESGHLGGNVPGGSTPVEHVIL